MTAHNGRQWRRAGCARAHLQRLLRLLPEPQAKNVSSFSTMLHRRQGCMVLLMSVLLLSMLLLLLLPPPPPLLLSPSQTTCNT